MRQVWADARNGLMCSRYAYYYRNLGGSTMRSSLFRDYG